MVHYTLPGTHVPTTSYAEEIEMHPDAFAFYLEHYREKYS